MSSDTMAEMNTKFEAKLTAKDEQIAMIFKQNEAILKTLTRLSQESNEDKENDPPNGQGKPRERRKKCKHGCGGWHKPETCWELPTNADKRPAN